MSAFEFQEQSVESALAQALSELQSIPDTLTLRLDQAADQVLAQDLLAPVNVPAAPTSAMDGYALNHQSWSSWSESSREIVLPVLGKSLAGHPAPDFPSDERGCVRIFTGARLPTGFDLVVPQEWVRQGNDNTVHFPADLAVRPGLNVRATGEDMAAGQVAIPQGQRLGPRELALLSSLGIAELTVRRLPRVAILSTGDELVDPCSGQTLDPSQTYDANRPMLLEMVRRLGLTVIDLGIVPDQPEALEACLRSASDQADLVMTSGGVSVGEADHTRRVMQTLGEIRFWRLSIKPGRPLAFGQLRNQQGASVPFFGLPGNPVASFVTFSAIVRPCLEKLAGLRPRPGLLVRAQLTQPTRKQPGRTEYLRCHLVRQPDGLYQAEVMASQGAASLKSLMEADGLAVLPEASGAMQAGDWVDVLPLIS